MSKIRVAALVRTGPLDKSSVIVAILGGALFVGLGLICLELARFGSALASIWLPAAASTALLLRARVSNELPYYAALAAAALAINFYAGRTALDSATFMLANVAEVAVVTWLTRRRWGFAPDMSDVQQLGQFLLFGGIAGPALSAAIVSVSTALSGGAIAATAASCFFAHSMGMILLLPVVLLTMDALQQRVRPKLGELTERIVLMMGGLVIVWGVFAQSQHQLLFLIPPFTLLMAFRVGSLGTAFFVPLIAIVASAMTMLGSGPIVIATQPDAERMYLLIAFVAANFLTGLPIAAILAGRARMTEELERGRSELALLTENVTDAVLRINDQGVCTYASSSVRDVLGRDPSDLLGNLIAGCTHPDARDQIATVLASLLGGESDQERVTYRRLYDAADGSPVFIEADAAIVTDPKTGERHGIVVSARDVTERVELELLLTRARKTAEEAAATKSEFLANMSHEIRTPMNGVLGFAELILQGDLNDEHRRHTEMIVQSGRSMMLLLNDILDLSKIEAGQIAIDHTPVDLVSTVNECVMLHLPVAEKKGLALSFHAPCSEPHGCQTHCNTGNTGETCDLAQPNPWIMTDALRLRQIVLNLVGNAVKFTEQGQVNVSCVIAQGDFRIIVEDTGIGINAAHQETIFAPFTQGENDTARRFGGTGLGLTISRQLADLLGGSIAVESSIGVGSTFTLTLPAIVAQPKEPEHPEPLPLAPPEPLQLPHSARVLLVEDNDVNRILGIEMLERCGQSVAVAHDGNEAIAMVMDSVMRDRPYDLVLMDIQMPGCDGCAATRAIRGEGIGPDIMPIIALSANAFPEDINATRDAGMQAHLAKPLVFAELARALQRWLPTRIIEAEDDTESNGALVTRSFKGDAPSASKQADPSPAQRHSPELLRRWNDRRSEAIEAVREALQNGMLSDDTGTPEERGNLARLVHKLAGTAAMFGEPELGDQAAAFERSLRESLPGDTRETLAFELLSVADDPADTLERTGT